jgi:hypothetical protein
MSEQIKWTASEDQAINDIEAIIDANSVEYALQIVAKVCRLKADHIQNYWQGEDQALFYNNLGATIDLWTELLFDESV